MAKVSTHSHKFFAVITHIDLYQSYFISHAIILIIKKSVPNGVQHHSEHNHTNGFRRNPLVVPTATFS